MKMYFLKLNKEFKDRLEGFDIIDTEKPKRTEQDVLDSAEKFNQNTSCNFLYERVTDNRIIQLIEKKAFEQERYLRDLKNMSDKLHNMQCYVEDFCDEVANEIKN